MNDPEIEHYSINKGVSFEHAILSELLKNLDSWIMEPLIKGERLLIYFKDDRTFIYDPRVRLILDNKYHELIYTVPELSGTVLDGIVVELDNGAIKFVAFDCLKYRSLDLRESKLIVRKKALLRSLGSIASYYEVIETMRPKALSDIQAMFKYGNGFVLKHLEGTYYPEPKHQWIIWRMKS